MLQSLLSLRCGRSLLQNWCCRMQRGHAVMKENAHFFISRFPFPPFPISISSFLVLPVPWLHSLGTRLCTVKVVCDFCCRA